MTTLAETRRDAARFAALAALDRRTVADALEYWALLDANDWQGSFVADVLPPTIDLTVNAQAEAASIGASYVDAAAAAQGSALGADRVSPWGFAGTASDGRSLQGLLVQPFIRMLTAVSAGAPAPMALQFGADSLDEIVTTQVQDAARVSETVEMAGNREIKGYLRAVEPGACSRCVVLAGRFYRFNEGFDRHPKCRCHHSPFNREVEPQSPQEIFDSMSPQEQARAFTKSGADAIRLGAEPNLVVNARRGMSTAQNGRLARVSVNGQKVFTTTEGTSKRGLAYQRLTGGATGRKKKVTRLMPESILEVAKNREDAIRLLRLHGFIL